MSKLVDCPRCNGGRRIRLDDQLGTNTPCALCDGKLVISPELDAGYLMLTHDRSHTPGSEVRQLRDELDG